MRPRGDRRDVQHFRSRINRRLEIHEPRARRQRGIEVGQVGKVDRHNLDAKARQAVMDHSKGVGVERAVDYELIALREQRQQQGSDSGHE